MFQALFVLVAAAVILTVPLELTVRLVMVPAPLILASAATVTVPAQPSTQKVPPLWTVTALLLIRPLDLRCNTPSAMVVAPE